MKYGQDALPFVLDIRLLSGGLIAPGPFASAFLAGGSPQNPVPRTVNPARTLRLRDNAGPVRQPPVQRRSALIYRHSSQPYEPALNMPESAPILPGRSRPEYRRKAQVLVLAFFNAAWRFSRAVTPPRRKIVIW